MKNKYAALVVLLLINILYFNNLFGQAEMPMAKCKGKFLGNVIDATDSTGADYNYNTYWNQATSENGCKWGSVETSQGVYNFSTCDVAYNWAKKNNGLFKYHNFAWGSQLPGYIPTASAATITAAVENYIAAVASHYDTMGGIDLIDVFNEPIHTPLEANYKAGLMAGYQAANPGGTSEYGWLIWVFQLARKYFPNAKLLMNEYSIENDPNGALITYAAMANALLSAPNLTDGNKNLIDGLGIECHAFSIDPSTGFTAAELQSSLDKLYGLTGLPMHITEMDIDALPSETSQKNQYAAVFPVVWQHPHVAGITLWGYVQGFTWHNGNAVAGPNGTDSGIMYASTYTPDSAGPRPALTWMQSYMATQPDIAGCPLPGTYGPGWATNACTTAAPATATNNIMYCVGAAANPLAATANSGGKLNWYVNPQGGLPLAAAPIPSTTTAGATYYYVTQTIGCESVRDTILVTVNQLLTAAVTTATPIAFCIGDSVILNADTATGCTYQWNNAGKAINGATATSYTANTSGNYTLTVHNANGCIATSPTTTVTVYSLPSAANAGKDQYVDTTITNLAAIASTAGTGVWSVVTGSGMFADSALAGTLVSGLSEGANEIQWKITNGTCPSDSSIITIYVGYAPVQQTIKGPDSVTPNQTGVTYSVPDSAGYTYHWTLPPGATIDSANADSSGITVTFGTVGGNVSVTETNLFGKTTSTLPITISSATGIIAGVAATVYEVRPNPFSDYTTIIVYSPATEQITLTIIDIKGTTCYSSSQYSTNQEFTVGKELSADGVYFVQLAFSSEIKVLKLVKIR